MVRGLDRYLVVGLLSLVLGMASCQSAKKVPYFLDLSDVSGEAESMRRDSFVAPIIESGDRLMVQILTSDPSSAEIFNPAAAHREGTMGGSAYTVDPQGRIHLPLIGEVPLAGLNLDQASARLAELARRHLVDPVVQVRFAHFPITVLGEVGQPGHYQSPTAKLSVLQALGMAGDLGAQARRDNILLIRETGDGQQLVYRYNLNASDLFTSGFYYLQPGDILYVSPNRAKARTAITDTSRDRFVGYFISGATLLLSVISIMMINNR